MGSTLNFSGYLSYILSLNPKVDISKVYGPSTLPNLIDRADCESTTPPALNGQITNALTACTFAQSAAQAHAGSNSYLLTKTGGVGVAAIAYLGAATGFNGLTPGHGFTFSSWIYVPAAGLTKNQVFIAIGYLDYTGLGLVERQAKFIGPYATWTQLTATTYVPVNATSAYVAIEVIAAGGNFTAYFDDLSMTDLAMAAILPGATMNIYDGRQPQDADTALYADNNLCATFTFPLVSNSIITPTGIYTLDEFPTKTYLRSGRATFARVNNQVGTLFDCSAGEESENPDIVLSQNPFTIGQAFKISCGRPDRFMESPFLGSISSNS